MSLMGNGIEDNEDFLFKSDDLAPKREAFYWFTSSGHMVKREAIEFSIA